MNFLPSHLLLSPAPARSPINLSAVSSLLLRRLSTFQNRPHARSRLLFSLASPPITRFPATTRLNSLAAAGSCVLRPFGHLQSQSWKDAQLYDAIAFLCKFAAQSFRFAVVATACAVFVMKCGGAAAAESAAAGIQ